jgi:hypothetical protein
MLIKITGYFQEFQSKCLRLFVKAVFTPLQGFNYPGILFGLFYSRYCVIFPIENSILFSQSRGKNSQLKVTK